MNARFRWARLVGAVAVMLALGSACGSIAREPAEPTVPAPPSPIEASSNVPSPTPLAPATTDAPAGRLPAPSAPIPTDAAGAARALATTTLALRRAIDSWTADGGERSWPAPRTVVLLSLYQQRMYRELAQHPPFASRVISRLPPGLAQEARTNVDAGRQLFSLAHRPTHRTAVVLKTRPPLPAGVLLGYYREAERRFHVSWEVLAAVNYIESKFGRVVSNSSAGAQGPMQFIPSTWAAYGLGGDVHDPHDAILGAANYLHASGAPGDDARALYAYNHAIPYVSAVLLYARRMANDPRAFFEYYNWQVFVLTPTGDQRLTGPGLH
jgi:Transglycosylase SLT domain